MYYGHLFWTWLYIYILFSLFIKGIFITKSQKVSKSEMQEDYTNNFEEDFSEYQSSIISILTTIKEDRLYLKTYVNKFHSSFDVKAKTILNNASKIKLKSEEFMSVVSHLDRLHFQVNMKINKILMLKSYLQYIHKSYENNSPQSLYSKNLSINKENIENYISTYDNLKVAIKKGFINKIGEPIGWNDISLQKDHTFGGYHYLNIGNGQNSANNGLEIFIPFSSEFTLLWIRCPNSYFSSYRVAFKNNSFLTPIYSCGISNSIAENKDNDEKYQQYWITIPIENQLNNQIVLFSAGKYSKGLISGLAFSKFYTKYDTIANLLDLHYAHNGGNQLSIHLKKQFQKFSIIIPKQKTSEMFIPITHSNTDKILYILTPDSDFCHNSLYVNDIKIDRFRRSYTYKCNNTYSNDLIITANDSTNNNSKNYQRNTSKFYLSTYIPRFLISNKYYYIKISLDLKYQDSDVLIDEIGTCDIN